VAQWCHITRPSALRAVILYPLNALVEDQLRRLRTTLDNEVLRAWLDQHRRGNRITFGRYTGLTPVAGPETADRRNRLRAHLREAAEQRRQVLAGLARDRSLDRDTAFFFPNLEGGEMWSRWDMQDQPPDILITNYSMMNIMLMRSMETPIFDTTRQWLAGDQSRLFHLVVDELHTYRGTPGTEVAYLIRVWLDRLWLTPDSSQLRIIASSASLTSDAAGLDYLEAFFGRNRNHFRVIGGNTETPDPAAVQTLGADADALRDLGQELRTSPAAGLPAVAQSFHEAVGAPPVPAGANSRISILATAPLRQYWKDSLKSTMGRSTPAWPQPTNGRLPA